MANPGGVDDTPSTKPSITHVIFDMDGLLLVYSGSGGDFVSEHNYLPLWHPCSCYVRKNSIFISGFLEAIHISGCSALNGTVCSIACVCTMVNRVRGQRAIQDTEKFYTEVQEIILSRYNKNFDWSLKAKMMGKKAIEAARIFVEETGIGDSLSAEDFLVEREEMLKNMFPSSELMPGASRLILHLHAKGIPICVATGSHRRHFLLKTQIHGELFSLMHHIVLGDDPEVKQGKPSPDVFLAAAKRFEGGPIDPAKILVFEDAPSGVLAAKNAGMSVVMVPDPRLDSSFHETADQVLSSLLDFNPGDWGLPPFDSLAS